MGQEQDLIMIINSNLKVTDQCLEAWNRANKMLAIINRNIVCKVLHLSYSNKEFSYEWVLTSVFGPRKRFGSDY